MFGPVSPKQAFSACLPRSMAAIDHGCGAAASFRRVWTALHWQGFSSKFCSAGRCGRVFDLLMRRTLPLAIMPSAKMDPDRKHALEAHRRKWVFPSSGFDRLSHYFMSALPNFIRPGAGAWSDLYATSGSR